MDGNFRDLPVHCAPSAGVSWSQNIYSWQPICAEQKCPKIAGVPSLEGPLKTYFTVDVWVVLESTVPVHVCSQWLYRFIMCCAGVCTHACSQCEWICQVQTCVSVHVCVDDWVDAIVCKCVDASECGFLQLSGLYVCMCLVRVVRMGVWGWVDVCMHPSMSGVSCGWVCEWIWVSSVSECVYVCVDVEVLVWIAWVGEYQWCEWQCVSMCEW